MGHIQMSPSLYDFQSVMRQLKCLCGIIWNQDEAEPMVWAPQCKPSSSGFQRNFSSTYILNSWPKCPFSSQKAPFPAKMPLFQPKLILQMQCTLSKGTLGLCSRQLFVNMFFQCSPNGKCLFQQHFNCLVVSRMLKHVAETINWYNDIFILCALNCSSCWVKSDQCLSTFCITRWHTQLAVNRINQMLKISHLLEGTVKIQPKCYCMFGRHLNFP